MNQLSNQNVLPGLEVQDVRQLLQELELFTKYSPAPSLTKLNELCDKLSKEKTFFVLQFGRAERILVQSQAQLVSRRLHLEELLRMKLEGVEYESAAVDGGVRFEDVEIESDDDMLSYIDDETGERVRRPSNASRSPTPDDDIWSTSTTLTSSATLLKMLTESQHDARTEYPDVVVTATGQASASSSGTEMPDGFAVVRRHERIESASPDGPGSELGAEEKAAATAQKQLWKRQ